MTCDGNFCCEDCEYFSKGFLLFSVYGFCSVYEMSVKETDEICDDFEERY